MAHAIGSHGGPALPPSSTRRTKVEKIDSLAQQLACSCLIHCKRRPIPWRAILASVGTGWSCDQASKLRQVRAAPVRTLSSRSGLELLLDESSISPVTSPTYPAPSPTAPALSSTVPAPNPAAPVPSSTAPVRRPVVRLPSPTYPALRLTVRVLRPTASALCPTVPESSPTAPVPHPIVPVSRPT